MTDLTYVVTVDNNKFAKKAIYQIKSINQNNPSADIFAYVTEGRGTDSLSEKEWSWLENQATIETGPVPIPDYPISAKTRAAAKASESVDSNYLLILDSDMLILDEIDIPEEGEISMTPVNIGDQEWGQEKKKQDWTQLCEKYGIEYPDSTIYSTVDKKPLPFPMYNVGVVFMENNDFAGRWEKIEKEMYEKYGEFHFLHQIAASLLAADYNVNVLPEVYNYPLNIRYYCPKKVKILHYHKFNQLKKLYHPDVYRKLKLTGLTQEQDRLASFWNSLFTPIRLRFLRSVYKNIPENSLKKAARNPTKAVKYIHQKGLNRIENKTYRFGRSLYDYEWDCAIILDACRYDLAQQNNKAKKLLGNPSRVYSLGANSERWMSRTFQAASEKQLQGTHYVTANIFSETAVPDGVRCTEVWKSDFDQSLSTVPPRAVTDSAVQIGREESPHRLLIHYMQPHLPPVTDNLDLELDLDFRDGWGADNPWRSIEDGSVDPGEIKEAYLGNLTPVIEELDVILQNISAKKVVVTADHGNMLGEFGKWGHFRANAIHPGVRLVPWWETSASDTKTYEPSDIQKQKNKDSLSREEKLQALGYK
jgi:hypothetical protein